MDISSFDYSVNLLMVTYIHTLNFNCKYLIIWDFLLIVFKKKPISEGQNQIYSSFTLT